MSKRLRFSCLLVGMFCVFGLNAQQNQGGISENMLQEIKKAYKNTAEDKALKNAVSNNDINKLALNRENLANYNTSFSHRVKTKGITDQKSSGRCWMFTGMNILRAKMIAKYDLGEFDFSQNYTFFWDQLEKSNLFLQAVIDTRTKKFDDKTVEWLFKNPIGDGGQFTGVADLIMKYGIVPQNAMPETHSSNNTSRMSQLLSLKLREFGLQLRDMAASKNVKEADLLARKTEMLGTIYRMLVLNLGEPVTSFMWAKNEKETPKQYTPKSFYEEFVGENLNDYTMFMNDPTREYYKVYEIEYDRHVYDGNNWKYINLPIEEIKEMAIKSIKDSVMMYFSCDVGKFYYRDKGLLDVNNFDYQSLMGTTFGMNKQQRIQTFASGSSHAMTLCAVDLDKDEKPIKWLVENSWGNTGYKGHLILTDKWFDEYMFRLVVEKKYIKQSTLDLLKGESIKLPPWDPMFLPEE